MSLWGGQALRFPMPRILPGSQSASCCLKDAGLLLLQHYACLHTPMLPVMMMMNQASETVSESHQLNVSFIRVAMAMATPDTIETLTKAQTCQC